MLVSRRNVLLVGGLSILAACGSGRLPEPGNAVSSSSKFANFNTFAMQKSLQGGHAYRVVSEGQTWESVFGGRVHIAKYANRQNVILRPGQYVLTPSQHATIASLSPFAERAYAGEQKLVVVSPRRYAWALYEHGNLTRWGPAVCGADFCADVGRACRTPSGRFVVTEKAGPDRRSNAYPPILAAEGRGALMPYYMRLTASGIGAHARYISGTHASHGCIGMFYNDAEWLNLQHARKGRLTVLVEPYST